MRPARRQALLATAALALAGCARPGPPLQGGWVGSDPARGHGLRAVPRDKLATGPVQRAAALVVGAGVAGLAAARALMQAGVDDIRVFELEDQAGGNSRGHVVDGIACPLGAHYLPLPGPQAHEVADWLHEIGLLHTVAGRTVADERHLCHSPQERLFIDGAWHEGLLPPAASGSATRAEYQRFAAAVARAQREAGFAIPSRRAPWTDAHRRLDAQTFAQWLDGLGLRDERLRWYLDYACRDDYGAPAAEVSAWAGLHYFGSRHGFHAPGAEDGEREAVLTWPEGNAWLVRHLAAPLGERLLAARSARRVSVGRHGVELTVWNEGRGTAETWAAPAVILAVPMHVAARIVDAPPPALVVAAALITHAPWLVAHLRLDAPLLDRGVGASAAWDNVYYGGASLGYVDAGHQRMDPTPRPTVLSAYWALAAAQRAALAAPDWRPWAQQVIAELLPLHPDLPQRLQRLDLARHGHAMAVPRPGVRGHAALVALADAGPATRLHFAHADLSGYSVFEEAFGHGHRAGMALARQWQRGLFRRA
ncbi:FAD-dependent oxidoreductase [Rubrivivax sp. A210]|uniref:FAD-dependent oxidoreductase n=1 Tax=Rubrivivax sp. A210 TaxID=2772301 RepID=UPI001F234650|nr:FAD-dependent oxidoreductase [Rubrivivax sp. A210]